MNLFCPGNLGAGYLHPGTVVSGGEGALDYTLDFSDPTNSAYLVIFTNF